MPFSMNSFFNIVKKSTFNPVGFRFHPTSEEIINYFLNHKINGRNYLVDDTIREINLLRYHPQDIPAISKASSEADKSWYFFNRLAFKYSNSKRANRRREGGFWKATGPVRLIKVKGKEIGRKRILVYHEECSGCKAAKTSWIIHEYTTISDESNFVLCKLKYKADEKSVDLKRTALPSVSKPIHPKRPENKEMQAQIDLKHSLSDEQWLPTTCSGNQHIASNLGYAHKDDMEPITLADSFLDLDDWPYEILPN